MQQEIEDSNAFNDLKLAALREEGEQHKEALKVKEADTRS